MSDATEKQHAHGLHGTDACHIIRELSDQALGWLLHVLAAETAIANNTPEQERRRNVIPLVHAEMVRRMRYDELFPQETENDE